MSETLPCIYGLYDKQGCLRYIGKANDPQKRLKGHLRDARRRNTPLYSWIRKYGAPEMKILESDCADWREAEQRLIAEAKARGDRLLNLALGGEEPFCAPSVRVENGKKVAAMVHGDAKRKRLWSLKQKLASALKRGFVSQKTIEKMRQRPDVFGDILNV